MIPVNDNKKEKTTNVHPVTEKIDGVVCDIYTPEEFDEWLEELADEG